MSAVTDLEILQASTEAIWIENAAVSADVKKSETLDAASATDVVAALLLFDSQVDIIQTQLDYLIQSNTATDTTTTASQIDDLQNIAASDFV